MKTNELHPNSICATPTLIPPNVSLVGCPLGENSYVDEVMCDLQGSNEETAIKRFRALSVRVGVVGPRELKNGGNRGTLGANLHPMMPAKQKFSVVLERLGAVFTVVLLLVALVAARYRYAPRSVEGAPASDLRKQIGELTEQVERLKQEQGMPASVLDRYRNSVGYIYGVYRVGFAHHRPALRARSAGTGFLIGNGLVATNRHVAEPWYGDAESEALIHRGASTTLESLVVFFPGSPMPLKLFPASVSKTSDLAILRTESSDAVRDLPVLPLAKAVGSPGQVVMLIGYPMGIAGMVAKSPTRVSERLTYRKNDIRAAKDLAALSLIRPSVTYGHLGDVINDELIYDAPTARGGSGGPVFNARGEVIGVNFAYMDGFSGATLGISVESLRPLLHEVQRN